MSKNLIETTDLNSLLQYFLIDNTNTYLRINNGNRSRQVRASNWWGDVKPIPKHGATQIGKQINNHMNEIGTLLLQQKFAPKTK